MKKRDFSSWFANLRESISDYTYYSDFEKIYKNVEKLKVELNILNSLIGSKNIEDDFEKLLKDYPKTLQCIPLLLAVRKNEIPVLDGDGDFNYSFSELNYTPAQYKIFMRKTGLFNLIEKHIVNNLVDYATGVETGLDSNARKNRGGHLMENLVERYLKKLPNVPYCKEMNLSAIQSDWNIDLSPISNLGKTEKRFDFAVKTQSMVYGIETNFYASSGSKLNETARSYKMLAIEAGNIDGFTFIWITDGQGWQSARNNLEETFDVLQHLYNIKDLENGVITALLKQ